MAASSGKMLDQPGLKCLMEAENQALDQTDLSIKQTNETIDSCLALLERLEGLPKKSNQDIMVPFGRLAFMPGKVVNPDRVLVGLGASWFVETPVDHAMGIIKRRIDVSKNHIKQLEYQRKMLQAGLDIASELEKESKDCVEIVEEYDEEVDKLWREKHKENLIKERLKEKEKRKSFNTDEILDKYNDDDDDGKDTNDKDEVPEEKSSQTPTSTTTIPVVISNKIDNHDAKKRNDTSNNNIKLDQDTIVNDSSSNDNSNDSSNNNSNNNNSNDTREKSNSLDCNNSCNVSIDGNINNFGITEVVRKNVEFGSTNKKEENVGQENIVQSIVNPVKKSVRWEDETKQNEENDSDDDDDSSYDDDSSDDDDEDDSSDEDDENDSCDDDDDKEDEQGGKTIMVNFKYSEVKPLTSTSTQEMDSDTVTGSPGNIYRLYKYNPKSILKKSVQAQEKSENKTRLIEKPIIENPRENRRPAVEIIPPVSFKLIERNVPSVPKQLETYRTPLHQPTRPPTQPHGPSQTQSTADQPRVSKFKAAMAKK